jgi:hypothetical protein
MKIAEKVKEFFHNEGIHSTTIQPEFVEVNEVSVLHRSTQFPPYAITHFLSSKLNGKFKLQMRHLCTTKQTETQ